jgi:hypothetical protein
MMAGHCSKCGEARDGTGRYCLACHAAYMREWRKTHRLSGIPLFKARVRAFAKVYKQRGRLVQQNCEACGSDKSQMHHESYGLPLMVNWLCRPCHLALHKSSVTHMKH